MLSRGEYRLKEEEQKKDRYVGLTRRKEEVKGKEKGRKVKSSE